MVTEAVKQRMLDIRTVRSLCIEATNVGLRAGRATIGAEDLLQASLGMADGVARLIFARIGVNPDGLMAAIEQDAADVRRGAVVEERLEYGAVKGDHWLVLAHPSAQAVLRELDEVMGTTGVTGGHVVAAVAGLPKGVAFRALKRMGVDPGVLREVALVER